MSGLFEPTNAPAAAPVTIMKGGRTQKLIEVLSRYSASDPQENEYVLVAYTDEPTYNAATDIYTYMPTDIYRRSGDKVEHFGIGMTVTIPYWDGNDIRPYCYEAQKRKLSTCTVLFNESYFAVGIPMTVSGVNKSRLTQYTQPRESVSIFATMADKVRPANIVPIETTRRTLTPEEQATANGIIAGVTVTLVGLAWEVAKWLLGSGSNSSGSSSTYSPTSSPAKTCTGQLSRDWVDDNKHYYQFELSKGGRVTYYTDWRRENNAAWDPLFLSGKGPFHYLYRSATVGATRLGWRIENTGQSYVDGIGDTTTSSALEALKLAASESEDCQIR